MDKIFFYDVGVRNMVIGNLAEPELRDDTGRLWENFLIAERRKVLEYRETWAQTWFWRLRTGAELDYVEEENGTLSGFEFKYGNKIPKAPTAWEATYPGSTFTPVNNSNWLDFVLGKEIALLGPSQRL